jgi:hypothetical protein
VHARERSAHHNRRAILPFTQSSIARRGCIALLLIVSLLAVVSKILIDYSGFVTKTTAVECNCNKNVKLCVYLFDAKASVSTFFSRRKYKIHLTG